MTKQEKAKINELAKILNQVNTDDTFDKLLERNDYIWNSHQHLNSAIFYLYRALDFDEEE